MVDIHFANPARYAFAREFLATDAIRASVYDGSLIISIDNPHLAILFHAAANAETWVLPVRNKDNDYWMVTGVTTGHHVESLYRRLLSFLSPTYAIPLYSEIRRFDENSARSFHKRGAALAAVGMYALQSRKQDYDKVLKSVALCLKVLRDVPVTRAQDEKQLPLHQWLAQFEESLAANDWLHAERCIAVARELTNAENVHFLRIRLLAAQQNWAGIWEYGWYRAISAMPVPRLVREAMLIAFHTHKLSQHETANDIPNSVAAFRQNRHFLGSLLITRAGIRRGEVLRIFAYLAADEGNYGLLQEVKAEAIGDFQTLYVIGELERLYLPSLVVSTPTRPLLDLARECLLNHDYDGALRFSAEMGDVYDRMYIRIVAANESIDPILAQTVLQEFDRLFPEDQEGLFAKFGVLKQRVNAIRLFLNAPEQPIEDWIKWFTVAAQQPDDKRLAESLEYLLRITDERSWTDDVLRHVVDILLGASEHSRHLRTGTVRLAAIFAQYENFPKESEAYKDWVDWCYGVLSEEAQNETLIRLLLRYADALLQYMPAKLTQVSTDIRRSLSQPSPALQGCAHEALDLLAYYGEQGAALEPWLRNWIERLLDNPVLNSSDALLWALFAQWVRADDLEEAMVNRSQTTQKAEQDPVSLLPEDFHIAIFSLDKGSSTRVQEVLLTRNSNLKVSLNSSVDADKNVETLANNADMVVLVYRCLKHAVTDTVLPILRDRDLQPVYPDARGSSSILRAIEQTVQTLQFA